MKRIQCTNLRTGKKYGPIILEDIEADDIISQHKGNKLTWGRHERWERIPEGEAIPAEALEVKNIERYAIDPQSMELILDEEGLPVIEGFDHEVLLPAEYDLLVEDVTSELSLEENWSKLRKDRDELLSSLDFTQLADAPMDSATKGKYREYRQYLRDITKVYTDENIHQAAIETFQEWKARKYPS